MASIEVTSTGTVAATRVPTYMSFSTATDAAPSVLTERVRISSNGYVGVGTTDPQNILHVYRASAGLDPVWSTNVDIVIFENSGNVNTQYFTPNDSVGYIGFSDPDARDQGIIAYSHVLDRMTLYANATSVINMDSSGVALAKNVSAQINTTACVEVQGYANNAILSLTRNDIAVLDTDPIGSIEWYTNDTTVTTDRRVASIDVLANGNYSTDAAKGDLSISVTGTAAGGSPIEHIRFTPTTVACIGFFGHAVSAQPAAIADATGTLDSATARLNDLLAGVRALGLIAT
jgi:hypothetical protein